MKNNYPLGRKSNIVIQDLESEVLIYDLERNKAFALNDTAASVWRMCDGKRSPVEISRVLSKKTRPPINEDIVQMALNQFKTDGLLENGDSFSTPFDGMSRRQMVKRIGFGSMIALPVISALVAPRAAHAQSGGCVPGIPGPQTGCVLGNDTDSSPNGCPCTSNPECAGVCPVTPNGEPRFCAGGPPVGPFCAPGNIFDQSADCCPCTSNPECDGVCPITDPGIPRVCAGGGV